MILPLAASRIRKLTGLIREAASGKSHFPMTGSNPRASTCKPFVTFQILIAANRMMIAPLTIISEMQKA